jgi:hypothetical protein
MSAISNNDKKTVPAWQDRPDAGAWFCAAAMLAKRMR